MKYIYNYLTTNTVNGKQYVGMHIGELDDGYLGSGLLIIKAIKKYGRINFIKEVLEICDNADIAHQNEEKYIIEYNTIAPNGYNLDSKGGRTLTTEETIEKMSNAHFGKKRKPFTEEHIENMIKSRRLRLKSKEKEPKEKVPKKEPKAKLPKTITIMIGNIPYTYKR